MARRGGMPLVAVVVVLLSWCSAHAAPADTKASTSGKDVGEQPPFVAPALNEVNSKLFRDLESLIVGGDDEAKKKQAQAKQKAVQQAVQAAVQQQALYDAYAYNMMRFQEAQAAALAHERDKLHHKHGKHKGHRKQHHHPMRFAETYGVPGYVGAPGAFPMLGMLPMGVRGATSSSYGQYYAGLATKGRNPTTTPPSFMQTSGVGFPAYPGFSYGQWPRYHSQHDKEDDEDDEDSDEDTKERHHHKSKPVERPDTPGEARFRQILALGTTSTTSPPLEYGDPLNGGTKLAPGLQGSGHLGGAMGAYGPPMDMSSGMKQHHEMQPARMANRAPTFGQRTAMPRFAQARGMNGPSTNPNPGGVPMPMYAPTPPPPPAPNQVPSPSTMVGSQIFPHNFQIPSSANMVPAAQGETAQPQANVGVQPMAPNAPSTSITSYPFNSFLQTEEKEKEAIHGTRTRRHQQLVQQARTGAHEQVAQEQAERIHRARQRAESALGGAESVMPADHYATWFHLPRGEATEDSRDHRVHVRLEELARHRLRNKFISPLLPEHTEQFPQL